MSTLGAVAKANAFTKIEKTIISCKTIEQIKVCYKMIDNFQVLFGDKSATLELKEFARDIFGNE